MPHRLALAAALLFFVGCDEAVPPDSTTTIPGCDGQPYAPAATSDYVLPYPVGMRHRVNLANCSSSYHAPGQPDRYAYDFSTDIGEPVTASRAGRVVHVEESGLDGSTPNNLVVVDHGDDTYAQYMHLTFDGADVEVGDLVEPGDAIGRGGNTGAAGYPHLHFVLTRGGWRHPYTSAPVSFRNADPLTTLLTQGEWYRATDR